MNKYKLFGRIKEAGMTTEELAEALGVSRSTFSKKVNGKSQFTQGEISKIALILSLPSEDVVDIFFNEKVSEKTH